MILELNDNDRALASVALLSYAQELRRTASHAAISARPQAVVTLQGLADQVERLRERLTDTGPHPNPRFSVTPDGMLAALGITTGVRRGPA